MSVCLICRPKRVAKERDGGGDLLQLEGQLLSFNLQLVAVAAELKMVQCDIVKSDTIRVKGP